MGQLRSQLSKSIGSQKAEAILSSISDRGDQQDALLNHNPFYDLKNELYDGSIATTCLFDGDIIRQVANWIDSNKQFFGNEILDVGCDCGVLTCFIARCFPDSHIVGIDRCEGAITVARTLAQKLDVHNVEFRHIPLQQMDDKQYDTVVSIRTLQENNSEDVNDFDHFGSFSELSVFMEKSMKDYLAKLTYHVKENGSLVMIERVNFDPFRLGLYKQIQGNKLEIDKHISLKCQELDRQSIFHVLVGRKELDPAFHDPYELMHEDFLNEYGLNEDAYYGFRASWYLERYRGEKYIDICILKRNGKIDHQSGVWTNNNNPETLMIYDFTENDKICCLYPAKIKQDLIDSIQKQVKEAEGLGLSVKYN